MPFQKENIQNYKDEDRKYLEKAGKLMQHKQNCINEIQIQFHCNNERERKTYKSTDIPQKAGEKIRRKTSTVYDTVKGELQMVDLRDGKSKCMVVPVFPGVPRVGMRVFGGDV